MAPGACGETFSGSVTGTLVILTNYHAVSPRKSWHHCAVLCLGEGLTWARLNCLDLRCSFEALLNAEYGGQDHLDFAARNYIENVRREETGIAGITYEQALWNLVVAMYGHYVDLFHCHTTTAGHRMVLVYNCLEVAAKLGRYHRAIRRLQPREELPDWIPTPEVPARDSQLDYVDTFTLLGDAMHPAFGHPKTLARAYDHVYYEGREMGNLLLRGKKSVDQSVMVYQAEYTQIVHRLSTLTRIDCEKFVWPMPTSLVHPEMVYPNKRYKAYCLKVPESGSVVQYEPVSKYEMDGLRLRIDLRPGTEVPVYPEDDVDADPSFNEYLAQEEFVEGPDWVPGQIPPKIRSLEYGEGLSDTSLDTQVARAIEAMLVTTTPAPDEVVASTSAMGDTRREELTPLPGLSQQFMLQMEREIQKQIQEQSWKLVQEVLHQSANQMMLPPSSEAAWASLRQCFQMALAAPCPTSAPSPELEKQLAEEPAQYSLADPFAGINPPPPEVLKESCPASQSSCGRTATRSESPKANYPPDEKKRSNSCPGGEAEPKRGHSSGAEPSWNLSHIGGRHSDKAPSQPTREQEAPESMPKLKSVVKKVLLDKAKPANFEDLGPAARSRYDTTGQDRTRWDKSQPRTESSGHSKDDHSHSKPRLSHSDRRSGQHDRNSSQSPNQKSAWQKDESLAAKLIAHKEHNKHYKKVVENLMLYLEECYHQIDPAEQLEVHSMRFFGAGAESAAIEVLALIDWAAKFLELSHSPVPEILAFLQRPFVVGKKVQFSIPEDPGDAIHKEKCVRTKAQKAWVYLCALLQFWTNEATTESGEIMYGGWHQPANPMIVRIRAVLNPSFGEHFQITWASIAASTSWTQARLYFRPPEREHFRSEPGPTPDMQNPLETTVELRWET